MEHKRTKTREQFYNWCVKLGIDISGYDFSNYEGETSSELIRATAENKVLAKSKNHQFKESFY